MIYRVDPIKRMNSTTERFWQWRVGVSDCHLLFTIVCSIHRFQHLMLSILFDLQVVVTKFYEAIRYISRTISETAVSQRQRLTIRLT